MAYQNRSNQPNWRRHSVKKKRRKFRKKFNKQLMIKNAVLIIAALFILGSIFSLGIFAWAVKDLPNPDELIDRNVIQSTKIYDSTGDHLLYEIHGDKNRTLVTLEEIPQTLINATIAVEDQQFYKHTGFNPIRIFKGVVIGQLFEGRANVCSTSVLSRKGTRASREKHMEFRSSHFNRCSNLYSKWSNRDSFRVFES